MLDRLLRRRRPNPAAGQLYASRERDGTYAVLRVLAVDPDAVSVRMYSNRFRDLASIDLDGLQMIGLGPDFLERQARGDLEVPTNLGIGHMPIDPRAFRGWRLTLVGERPVEDDELEGYRCWREDTEGGAFT